MKHNATSGQNANSSVGRAARASVGCLCATTAGRSCVCGLELLFLPWSLGGCDALDGRTRPRSRKDHKDQLPEHGPQLKRRLERAI